mgnify:FL=1
MKKTLSLLLALLLSLSVFTVSAQAEFTEDQVAQLVMDYLDFESYEYDYNPDTNVFSLYFSLDCALEYVDVSIYAFDDMILFEAESPIEFTDELFENAAIFTTLANSGMYYAHFVADRDFQVISCRNFQLIESELPGAAEIETLLSRLLSNMETYGAGIVAVCRDGADPYDAFEACSE